MRRLIYILSITCIAFGQLAATGMYSPDERNKPGDDKKGKAKRDDTTKFVVSAESNQECTDAVAELEESPDTNQVLFPSHDLYSTWDVNSAHPYNFNESFKSDSVVIQLVQEGDGGFVLPFKGDLTSLFGWRRYRPHYGTDIKLITGEKVAAAFDGMVRLAKYYQGYGNCVIIRHNNGLETVYAHLSKILVQSGQTLSAGTVIGLGGNTGHSYGSHLHFEIRYLGQALDTQDFIDFEKGELKATTFVLRKADVENKYDLRALHNRHKHDLMQANRSNKKATPGIYIIRRGDTLGAIARRTGTPVKVLCKKNKLKPTSTLRIGQRLKT
jgi:murein DD-endopeptidase MepM/ murein hydrolase activator NlpD